MATSDERDISRAKKIVVEKVGPYVVYGDIPLVRKAQVVSEHGEPLTWKKGEVLETIQPYRLCRSGQSTRNPFCVDSHAIFGFDGTETAQAGPTVERQVTLTGGTHIVVKRDYSLCAESGFCGDRLASIEKLVGDTDDTRLRSLVIAMIERCPSGSFTYSIQAGEPDIEPDLPQQIAVTTEITSDGPRMHEGWPHRRPAVGDRQHPGQALGWAAF